MQFSEKLWKTRENIDIKLVTAEIRRNCLVSEPNYYITKFLTEHLLATEMKKKTTRNTYEQTCLFRFLNTINK